VKSNVLLAEITTFGNKGSLPQIWAIDTIEALRLFVQQHPDLFVLGKGSNTLINPTQAKRPIVRLSKNLFPTSVSNDRLTVGAGVTVNRLMQLLQKNKLSGLEFTAGVPATIGGMICMNFGCWGTEISDLTEQVYIMDRRGKDFWLPSKDLGFGYRQSEIQAQSWIVLAAEFRLEESTTAIVRNRIQKTIQTRLAKQPLRARTFGSVFKNPNGAYAGQLIEQLGYKGQKFGSVMMSDTHANFMVNLDQATYADAKALIHQIQKDAKNLLGIELELEVCSLE